MKGSERMRAAAFVVAVSAAALLAACSGGEEDLAVLYPTPDFALVDQRGDTLRSPELEGRVWVAHLFFTSCTGVCPLTTQRMAEVRDSLASGGLLGERVRLVSFSVDPARDSLPAVRQWARRHGGGEQPPGEWAFLRGSSPGAVRSLIQEGFHMAAVMPADTAGNYQVTHSQRVLLVDSRGRVRAIHPILEPGQVGALLADIRQLTG